MKKLQILLSALLIAGSVMADDFDSFEDSFSFDEGTAVEASSALSINGDLIVEERIVTPKDSTSQSIADLNLELSYEKENSDMYAKVKFDEEGEVKLDEAYIRMYYNDLTVEAGRIKNVWGKGDMLHAVDFMNAMDLSDLFAPDYIDRSVGEDMIKLSYSTDGVSKYIFAWAPNFTPNSVEMENGNVFTPSSVQSIYSLVDESTVRTLLDNGDDIENNQFALRYTNSTNGLDYGLTLYKGYDKDANLAGVKMVKAAVAGNSNAISYMMTNGYYKGTLTDLGSKDLTKLNIKDTIYTENYALGAEFSKVLFGLNAKGEFAYNYTEDTKGDDPMVPNNNIDIILGFDRDLGISALNLNFQYQGKYLLNSSKADDNLDKYAFDADTSYDGEIHALSNRIIATLTDKYKYDTILPESKIVYQVEDGSFLFANSVEYKLKDDISLTVGYNWYSGDDDSTFGQYDNADYAFGKFVYNF